MTKLKPMRTVLLECLAVAVAGLLAACGSVSATPTPIPSPTPEPTSTPAATAPADDIEEGAGCKIGEDGESDCDSAEYDPATDGQLLAPGEADAPETPGFELPSVENGTVRLDDYRGHQPLALIFYRTFY
ncbi:MAG: hypothetical protein ACOC5M_01730 [Chloroflexota bacterium]